MKYLLVIFFLYDGVWVEGEAAKGWGPFPYETEAACLEGRTRAGAIHANLKLVSPRAIEKRFECIAEQIESNN